jgi:hypothetical protein
MYVCMYVCVCVCMYVCVCVCMYMCMYVCVCMYVYIYYCMTVSAQQVLSICALALIYSCLNTKFMSTCFGHMSPSSDGCADSKHFWNVGKLLPDYTAQHLRRQLSSNTPL